MRVRESHYDHGCDVALASHPAWNASNESRMTFIKCRDNHRAILIFPQIPARLPRHPSRQFQKQIWVRRIELFFFQSKHHFVCLGTIEPQEALPVGMRHVSHRHMRLQDELTIENFTEGHGTAGHIKSSVQM